MAAATLQPAAGAAGELTGLLLMRAWHEAQGSDRRTVIIPDSAHGTNPASVTLAGYEVVTVPSDRRGCVDMAALNAVLDDERRRHHADQSQHPRPLRGGHRRHRRRRPRVGGLLYYDGANLNAILGVVRPGDMGFDIVHMNLHKTFATPHGGGGPGAGPGGGLGAAGATSSRDPGRSGRPVGRAGRRLRMVDPAAVDRADAHLARQRPGPGPGPGLHPRQRGRRPAPGGRGRRAQCQLAAHNVCPAPTTCPSIGPACTRSSCRPVR